MCQKTLICPIWDLRGLFAAPVTIIDISKLGRFQKYAAAIIAEHQRTEVPKYIEML